MKDFPDLFVKPRASERGCFSWQDLIAAMLVLPARGAMLKRRGKSESRASRGLSRELGLRSLAVEGLESKSGARTSKVARSSARRMMGRSLMKNSALRRPVRRVARRARSLVLRATSVCGKWGYGRAAVTHVAKASSTAPSSARAQSKG